MRTAEILIKMPAEINLDMLGYHAWKDVQNNVNWDMLGNNARKDMQNNANWDMLGHQAGTLIRMRFN